MPARSLLLALTALALFVPPAQAGLGDELLASKGVSIGKSAKSGLFVRFGPGADRLYRSLAGERVTVSCVSLKPDGTIDDFGGRRAKLPPRRTRVLAGSRLRSADFCTISERQKDGEFELCLRNARESADCVRTAVAATDRGREYLDSVARSAELFLAEFYLDLGQDLDELSLEKPPLSRYFSALAGPDASPPSGKVGYWTQGGDTVVASLLQDGTRRFISRQAGVLTTNDPAFLEPNPLALTVHD
jgi:hypothetical protein